MNKYFLSIISFGITIIGFIAIVFSKIFNIAVDITTIIIASVLLSIIFIIGVISLSSTMIQSTIPTASNKKTSPQKTIEELKEI